MTERRPASQPLAWLLLGNREGDNNQLRALAVALGFPFECKRIAYNSLRHLAFLRHGLTTVALEFAPADQAALARSGHWSRLWKRRCRTLHP